MVKALVSNFKLFGVFAIFILGVFFRLWNLDKVPIELFGDEIDVGLQAYSILSTGKDYLGNTFPVMFHSFSEYRLPMQLYLDVPFIKLFGMNEIGVRGPAALMGFLSLILFFYLVKELFNKKIALIAFFALMFSPWHFNFSRQANDAGILLPFVIGGVLFFVKGLKDYKYLLLSVMMFSLSIYSYSIAIAFVPLLVLSLVIIFRKKLFRYPMQKLIFTVLVGVFVASPYLYFTAKGLAGQRFSYISAISMDKVTARVIEKRILSDTWLSRLFYNKATVTADVIGQNYIHAFSSSFLFVDGDPNPRQGIGSFGQMYHYEFLLVILGLVISLSTLKKGENDRPLSVVLVWLAFAPMPSSLTVDGGYHASRLILMLPPLIILSAIGLNFLFKTFWQSRYKILLVLLALFIIFDISKFMHSYFAIWPKESWKFWQYGFKETYSYVKSIDSSFDKVYFNNVYEPALPRFLFYYGYDMKLFQDQFMDDKRIENIAPGIDGFNLGDKYYFGELEKPLENFASKGILFVASGDKDVTNPHIFDEANLKLYKVTKSPSNIPIFYVYSSKTE